MLSAHTSLRSVLRSSRIFCILLSFPVITSAENHNVNLGFSAFNPNDITIRVGDTVTWKAVGGTHNVVANDGSFRCAQGCDHTGGNGDAAQGPWTVKLKFDKAGTVNYHCEVHRQLGMVGKITVTSGPATEFMDINFGHSGSWFNAATDGQGLSLEVVPDDPAAKAGTGQLVAYWFTFAKGERGGLDRTRWYVAQGAINGPEAVMEVFQVTGGVFDSAGTVAREAIGTATISFSSCTAGILAYSLDLDGNQTEESANEIPLTRLTPDVLCENMVATQ